MNLRNRKKGNVAVNTDALNDIMFFLMLFFLLASAVVNPQVVKLLLPRSSSGQQANNQKSITVSIDDNLNYFVDKQPVALDNMEAKIQSMILQDTDATIVLYVARGVSIENTMQVFDVANKLRLKVVLAIEQKK